MAYIYLIINEIPVQSRFNSAIVVGLWFGKGKPEMSVFLEIFVETMNQLSENGINCTIKEDLCCVKVYALLACVDTVARAPMNGSSQFNAYFGCDWCEHPGEYFQGSMRYPYLVPPAARRTEATTVLYAKEALTKEVPVNGIKYASPLLNLKLFDIINGFVPDYMHCMLAGVAEQFTGYLLSHLSNNDLDKLDTLLVKIKVPHQIGRLTRSVKERGFWKAREGENWTLYYSIPVLSVVSKGKRPLQHWSLFVESLFIALQMKLTYAELNYMNKLLDQFVYETKDLYSLSAMTYNVHQLQHVAQSIYDWGPLWAHSTFAFESANHKLISAIQCAKGVIQQIIRYINLQRTVQILEKIVYPTCSNIVIQFCERLIAPQSKKCFKLEKITYFGKGKIIDESHIQNYNLSRNTKSFSKIVLNGCLFTTSKKVNMRSCNYYA